MPKTSSQLLPALSQSRLIPLNNPASTWFALSARNKLRVRPWPAAPPPRSNPTRSLRIQVASSFYSTGPTSRFYSTKTSGGTAESAMTSPFRLSDYDCIGFDLDHTLARYRLENLYPLIYTTLCRFLVERKGYDARLLEPLGDGRDFLTKGLLVDARRGNLLKVGKTGTVLRASHGTRHLSDEEIVATYGLARQWQPLQAFRNTMCEGHGKPGQAMRAFKDHFDIPAALASARIVDLIDQSTNKLANEDDIIQPDFEYDFLKDIRLGLIDMFRSEAFALGTGGYFSAVREDVARYLIPCDDITKQWLRQLRDAGKFVFLLTGSAHDYGSLLGEYCLGPDWRDYFDVVVTTARKPGFFTGQRPFLSIDGNVSEAVRIQRGDMVAQGNYGELLALAETTLGRNDPRALYFGDNLIQDVFTPAKFARCHAVAVVEEMEAEGMVGSHDTHPAATLLFSKRWGSFFCDAEKKEVDGLARIDTLWAELVLTHSQLAVPSVACLANVPIDQPLTRFNATDPTSPSGFYPSDPAILHPTK